MSAEELRELAASIGKNGLNDPILLFEDQILDGVHRGKGCVMSGEPPTYLQWDDLELVRPQGSLARACVAV